jgi:hypothetical protein
LGAFAPIAVGLAATGIYADGVHGRAAKERRFTDQLGGLMLLLCETTESASASTAAGLGSLAAAVTTQTTHPSRAPDIETPDQSAFESKDVAHTRVRE